MVNKSKGDYSYTMIDLDSKVTDAVVKHLEGIEGVIKVRVIKYLYENKINSITMNL